MESNSIQVTFPDHILSIKTNPDRRSSLAESLNSGDIYKPSDSFPWDTNRLLQYIYRLDSKTNGYNRRISWNRLHRPKVSTKTKRLDSANRETKGDSKPTDNTERKNRVRWQTSPIGGTPILRCLSAIYRTEALAYGSIHRRSISSLVCTYRQVQSKKCRSLMIWAAKSPWRPRNHKGLNQNLRSTI